MALFGKRDKDDEGILSSVTPVVTSDAKGAAASGREASEPTVVGPALRVKGEMTGQEDVTVEGGSMAWSA